MGVAILFSLVEGVVLAAAAVVGVMDLRSSFLADFGVDLGVAAFLGVELFSLPGRTVLGVSFIYSWQTTYHIERRIMTHLN